jgi:hypothetical protein
MLSMALHVRDQELSLRDIAAGLVITKGKKKGQHPHPPPSCACCADTSSFGERLIGRRQAGQRNRSVRAAGISLQGDQHRRSSGVRA